MRIGLITSSHIRCVGGVDSVKEEETLQILRWNNDFLCKQIYDINSDLDDNSVLWANMLFKEILGRYREVIGSRIGETRNQAVREVLTTFRDWSLVTTSGYGRKVNGMEDSEEDIGGGRRGGVTGIRKSPLHCIIIKIHGEGAHGSG